MGEEKVNCILGGLWLDGNAELLGSATVKEDPTQVVVNVDNFEAAEAEDSGGAAAADEVGRPRVKPGMLQIGRVKSVRRLGTSTTCNNPGQQQ